MSFRYTTFAFCLTFIFITGSSIAQENSASSKVSVALRGKYYVFGALENLLWRGYSYGAEIHFGKHHSIGTDGGMFRTRWDNDDGDDSDGSVILSSDIIRRTFVYFDYKYLFAFKNQMLYAQCYTKQNGRCFSFIEKQDKEYAQTNPVIFEEYGRGKFTEYGLGLGAMLYFKKTEGRFGVDVNLNLAFRNGSILTKSYSNTEGWHFVSDSDDLIYPYLRFTLFYHFFRYQK